MHTYEELLRFKAEIDAKIAAAQSRDIKEAIQQAKTLIARFDLQPSDLFPGIRNKSNDGRTFRVPPKYRNPVTGQTWTGRGKAPKWIEGQDRTKFFA